MLIPGGERLLIHTKFYRLALQIALPAFVTHTALEGVVDIIKFGNVLPLAVEIVRVGGDHGTVDGFLLTGEDHPFDVFDFHHAHPAGGDGLDFGEVTHGGDVNVVGACDLEDRLTPFAPALLTIDRYGNGFVGFSYAHITPPPSKYNNTACSALLRQSPLHR